MALGRDDGQKRAKNNSFRLGECADMLRRLAAILAQPGFDGRITIELSAKDGYFGRPKQIVEEWGTPSVPHD